MHFVWLKIRDLEVIAVLLWDEAHLFHIAAFLDFKSYVLVQILIGRQLLHKDFGWT